MKLTIIAAMLTAALGLSACDGMSTDQRTVAGVAGGAAAGLIAAEALNADNNWRLISGLAGAAAGTLVAQQAGGNTCAYARGDGTYYRAACK